MTALLNEKSTTTAAAAAACLGCGGRGSLGRELSGIAGLVERGNQRSVVGIPVDAYSSALQIDLDGIDSANGVQCLSDVSNAGAARHALNLKLGEIHEKPSVGAGQSG